MIEQKKKSNILLALLLSLLTALAGATLFGAVYGLGYYIYVLATVEIILAVRVYLKFAPNTKAYNIIFAVIWGLVWTFIFNILAVVVCEALLIAKELGASFTDSYNAVIELWKTNSEVKAYMNKRILEIFAMILIGGIIYGFIFIISVSQSKKQRKDNKSIKEEIVNSNHINNSNPQQIISNKPITQQYSQQSIQPHTQQNAQQLYLELYDKCKSSLLKYSKNKDQETFKLEIKELKEKHISSLDSETKQSLIDIINKVSLKLNEDLPTIANKTNELLLKIIK